MDRNCLIGIVCVPYRVPRINTIKISVVIVILGHGKGIVRGVKVVVKCFVQVGTKLGRWLLNDRKRHMTVSTCYVKVGTKLERTVICCPLLIQITVLRSFQFPSYMSIFLKKLVFVYFYHGLRSFRWLLPSF